MKTIFEKEIKRLKVIEDMLKMKLSQIRRRLQAQLDARAVILCPLKLGEILERTVSWGWQQGKTRTLRHRVTRIKGEETCTGYSVLVTNIKKDGTDGGEKTLWSWDINKILKERKGGKEKG